MKGFVTMRKNGNDTLFVKMKKWIIDLLKGVKVSSCIISVIASSILAFGLYNVHSVSKVTEGGILGLTLLLEYWFKISPALSGFILNLVCYITGWKLFGKNFLFYSMISTAGFSLSYKIFEQFPPLFPEIANMPLLAAIVGALFVGVGAGFCVKAGGAPSGDDALAMIMAKLTGAKIQWMYLITDITVLLMSLTYIPLSRMAYSVLTVIISGQLVGLILKINFPWEKTDKKLESQEVQDVNLNDNNV